MEIYLVGGAVRDTLLGREPKDADYVVVGSYHEEMLSKGFSQVGNGDFPVYIHPTSGDEYSLARTELKTGSGYSGFNFNVRDISLEEDLSRRDLTINSMYLRYDGTVGDFFGGLSDIENKVLRHTSEAFSEDPLRVLRVARFLARFGSTWSIHPSTRKLMEDIRDSGNLSHLTPERVWKETEKALSEPYPHLFFETLEGCGVFPEIDVMRGVPQPKEQHPEGCVYTHTMLVLQRAVELDYPTITRFACLMHDLGKPVTYGLRGNLHGHEQAGVEVIEDFCKKFRVPNKYRDLAVLTSDNHTRCHKVFEMNPKKIRVLLNDRFKVLVKPERFQRFLEACLCDAQGRGLPHKEYPQKEFLEKICIEFKNLDRKKIVSHSLDNGRKGESIKQDIIREETKLISVFKDGL